MGHKIKSGVRLHFWTFQIRHLGCINVLANARICGPVSMISRSSETNFQCGYGHKCIYGCLLTAIKVG